MKLMRTTHKGNRGECEGGMCAVEATKAYLHNSGECSQNGKPKNIKSACIQPTFNQSMTRADRSEAEDERVAVRKDDVRAWWAK